MKTYTYEEFYAANLHAVAENHYGGEGEDRFTHTDINDAIEECLDALHPDQLEGELTICVFRNYEVELDAGRLLQGILEDLDERYGDIEGSPTDATPAMTAAAEALAAVLIAEYQPWLGETVSHVIVDVPAWVAEHRPDWLEEPTP